MTHWDICQPDVRLDWLWTFGRTYFDEQLLASVSSFLVIRYRYLNLAPTAQLHSRLLPDPDGAGRVNSSPAIKLRAR